MLDAVSPETEPADYYALRTEREDGGYLLRLVQKCRDCIGQLSGYEAAKPYIRDLAGLYTDLQVYKHIHPDKREAALLEWWSQHAHRTPHLRWNEFAATTGSTLGVFMLFLVATDPFLDDEDASSIHASYFPNVCSLHIMLDYLIDQDEDRLGGDLNFCNYYEDADTMLNRIASIVEWARKDVRTIPSTPFHRMIIEGLLALYLSDQKSAATTGSLCIQAFDEEESDDPDFSTSTADGFASISMSDIEGGKETWQRLKIAVLTSGGDSQGMNAALRAVVRAVCIMVLKYMEFSVVTKDFWRTTSSKWIFAA